MTDTAEQQMLRMAEDAYAHHVAKIASDLRRLADDIDRRDTPGDDPVGDACRIVSLVHNTLPNLAVSVLVGAAQDIATFRGRTGAADA